MFAPPVAKTKHARSGSAGVHGQERAVRPAHECQHLPHMAAPYWDFRGIPLFAPSTETVSAPHAPSAAGRPLDASTRAFFEPRFGRDLGRVRIHDDETAAISARAANAVAYTFGQHIVFDRGSYEPGSPQGRRLLAHELTHTLQQSRAGPPPGARQERDAEEAARSIDSGAALRVGAPSGIGFAAQPRAGATISDDLLDPDRALGISVVKLPAIEAKVRKVVERPGPEVSEGKADFNADPRRAKANLYHTHFRDDAARLSYALGVFRTVLGMDGGQVDREELVRTVLTYEAQIEGQGADLVVHGPPTRDESRRLSELRTQRRAEMAARGAERKREAAAQEAQRVRQERERAKPIPKGLADWCDPSEILASGPYADQGIVLPYDKLVGDEDPGKGFDEDEVRSLVEPKRLEQLYYDATHGLGKAIYLVCNFESKLRLDAGEGVHYLHDVTTFSGLVNIFLGTGRYKPNLSPKTASGRRGFVIFAKAYAAESGDVQLSNTVLTNMLNLWAGGKLAEATLANMETRIPGAMPPPEPLRPEPAPTAPSGQGISVPATDPRLYGTPANDPHPQPQVAQAPLAATGTGDVAPVQVVDTGGAPDVGQGASGAVMGKKPPRLTSVPGKVDPAAKPGKVPGKTPATTADRPRATKTEAPKGDDPAGPKEKSKPDITARPAPGLPSPEEDAIVRRYTAGLADLRDRISALRHMEAEVPRDTKRVSRAQAAYESVDRDLQSIEDDAAKSKDSELAGHLDPLVKERETINKMGTTATTTGVRVPCQAVSEAPKHLRGMDFADIDSAMKRPPDVVEAAKRDVGRMPTAHQRLWWKFDDGSRLVIDYPREFGGRAPSADLPHAELHGPKGERLDQQGIVVPEQTIATHMTITDHTGVAEIKYFVPARAKLK
jgi:Domain of unknown function (DUF4157)